MSFEYVASRPSAPRDRGVHLELRDTRNGRPYLRNVETRDGKFYAPHYAPRHVRDTLLTCPTEAELRASAKEYATSVALNMGKTWGPGVPSSPPIPAFASWDARTRDRFIKFVGDAMAELGAESEKSDIGGVAPDTDRDELGGATEESGARRDGLQYPGAAGGFSSVGETKKTADKRFMSDGQREVYRGRLAAQAYNDRLNVAARERWNNPRR